MIRRYTNPEMGAIWSEQRRYETWLEVELAAADAMAEAGLVPGEAARDLRARAGFDIGRIEEIEQTTQHDVIAFTTAVAEQVGPSARWLHFGLTSSDVVDTAQAIQMRDACDLIVKNIAALMETVRSRADEHRRTPMIGRTHGVHAEPMTFGLKLALWYAELQRDLDRVLRAREIVSVGKVSGAVGTFAHLDPSIEASVCQRLGLEPAPVSSQRKFSERILRSRVTEQNIQQILRNLLRSQTELRVQIDGLHVRHVQNCRLIHPQRFCIVRIAVR